MQIFCHYVVIVLNFELLFNTLKAVSAYVLHANIYSAINQVKDFIPPICVNWEFYDLQ